MSLQHTEQCPAQDTYPENDKHSVGEAPAEAGSRGVKACKAGELLVEDLLMGSP